MTLLKTRIIIQKLLILLGHTLKQKLRNFSLMIKSWVTKQEIQTRKNLAQEKPKPRTESDELSGTGEKSTEDIKKYPFLKPVFNSNYVTIYKVEIS